MKKDWELPCGPTVWAVMLGLGLSLAALGEWYDAVLEDLPPMTTFYRVLPADGIEEAIAFQFADRLSP